MESFTSVYDEKIRPLMDRIDQARSLISANNDGIVFPNVVVVGDQSSGKSTLLEALSLVELPKGSGIVTRCPLVLRLRRSNERKVYHLIDGNQKVLLDETTLDMPRYINEETKKLAGDGKNIVSDLIEILVEDPNVRDLTVVDLPGIARNPIGDQPKDIHKQTTDLIRRFIQQEGSVILCVFPANVDIATAESFTLAREVDPEGLRTIGVATKADLATDPKTLIDQLLMERADVLYLKLGFVAVRNRSADETISLEDAREREKHFFREHSAFATVGSNYLGIYALIQRLADLYSDRVREMFPKLKNDIHNKLRDVLEQLSKLPPALETSQARVAKYHELSEFYVETILNGRFMSSDDGKTPSAINTIQKKLARFSEILQGQAREFVRSTYHVKVRTAMDACFGEQLPNFLSYPVLKRLVCEKLDQLKDVTSLLLTECFEVTCHKLFDDGNDLCKNNILFTKLLPLLQNVSSAYVDESKRSVHNLLTELIRLEKHDPCTLNDYYMITIHKFEVRAAQQKEYEQPRTPDKTQVAPKMEDQEDELLFNSIANQEQPVRQMIISVYAYWKLLLKRFEDYACLAIRASCIFDVCSGIRVRLRQISVEQPDIVDAYLAEDSSIRYKRKQLQQTKERLEKVKIILGGGSLTMNVFDEHNFRTKTESISLETLDQLAEKLSCTENKTQTSSSFVPLTTSMVEPIVTTKTNTTTATTTSATLTKRS